jgi:integrase
MAKRMRGLYKRGRVWWCCYKDINERVVRESTQTQDYDDAIDFLMKRRGEVKAGIEPEKKKIVNHPFNELVAEYKKWASRQRSFYIKIHLINHCDPHLKPIVITALNSGMRRGEILGLKWDQVDLKHGFILLDITKNGERREIPINGTLRGVLKGITRRLDIPWVFHDPVTGKPYQDNRRSFHTALRRAGIRDFHFHDLRHTFASHLVIAGVDLTTVKEPLGLKTLSMTLRYAHLAPTHKVKAVDILDKAINTPTSQLLHKMAVSG